MRKSAFLHDRASSFLRVHAVLFYLPLSQFSYAQSRLFAEGSVVEGSGENPPIEEIRDQVTGGYAGTKIDVNNIAVKGGQYDRLGIDADLYLSSHSKRWCH